MEFNAVLIENRMQEMRVNGLWLDETSNDHLDACLATCPDKIAIVAANSGSGEKTVLTFREFAKRVDRAAAGLSRLGIKRHDVVAMQLPNWWEFSVIVFACARIGAACNPLMPIFRHHELRFMLAFTEARVVIIPDRFRGFDFPNMYNELSHDLPDLEHVVTVGGAGQNNYSRLLDSEALDHVIPAYENRAGPDDIVQLMFTSGTTGEPKGVMHSSNTLFSNIRRFAERLGLGAEDTIHMPSPMAHQLGYAFGALLPVMLGASVVLQDIWDPETCMHAIRANDCRFIMGATPFLADLSEYATTPSQAPENLRYFVSAGAPIPGALVDMAGNALGAKIISAWGMTENSAVTLVRPDDPGHRSACSDGVCLPGMETRIIGPEGSELPSNEEGFLQVRGCSQFGGYLKRSHLNATDAEGWFDTGDMARMDDHGYIRICGRSKDVIIRGGENIPVVEIEAMLFKHPAIASVALVAFPDERLGERACAFVALNTGQELTFQDMIRYLKDENVTTQFLPERLEIMTKLPSTPSGKVQKFKLREIAKTFSTSERKIEA